MAQAVKEKQKDQENSLVQLFHDTKAELSRVHWPTREETIRLTVLVIAVSFAIGLLLFLGDTIFIWLYSQLVGLVQSL